MSERCKVVVYIPSDSFSSVMDALAACECNRIGDYINCMSWSFVRSCWTPMEGAGPYVGAVGQRCEEDEIRLEMTCERRDAKTVADIIREVHPYEEPEIDLYEVSFFDKK